MKSPVFATNLSFLSEWHAKCKRSVMAVSRRSVINKHRTFLEDINMFSWALTFLVIGLIAAVFGFTGIAGTATNIAWILFVVGIILAIVFAVAGRRGPRV